MPQLDILSVWSNTTGHMALINCAISASYATFSAFVTLPWCINIDRTTPPVLSVKSKVTWKNEQYLGGHVPLRFKGRIMTNINNATAQRAVQMREREGEQKTICSLLTSPTLCWWKALHARETRHEETWKNGVDNTMRTGEEERKHKGEVAMWADDQNSLFAIISELWGPNLRWHKSSKGRPFSSLF